MLVTALCVSECVMMSVVRCNASSIAICYVVLFTLMLLR